MKFDDIVLKYITEGSGFLKYEDAQHFCELANKFNNIHKYKVKKNGDYYQIILSEEVQLGEGIKDIALAGMLGAGAIFGGTALAKEPHSSSPITSTTNSKSQTKSFDMDKLIEAIYMVESSKGSNKNIKKEDQYTSLGPLQITRDLLDDVNNIIRKTKRDIKPFIYNDRLSLEKSKQILRIYFEYYINTYNIKPSYVNLARMWNGGPTAYRRQNSSAKELALKKYVNKILQYV